MKWKWNEIKEMEWWKTSTSTRTLTLSCRKNTPNLKKNELNEWKMNEMKISFHFNYFILLWLELNNRSNNNMKNNKTVHRKTFKKKSVVKKFFVLKKSQFKRKTVQKFLIFSRFSILSGGYCHRGDILKIDPGPLWKTIK